MSKQVSSHQKGERNQMINTTQQKAVFFDLDDTLYDHLIPFRHALINILGTSEDFPYAEAYHRMRYYSDTLSEALGGTPTHGEELREMRMRRFMLALAEFGINLDEVTAEAVQNNYLDLQYSISVFQGAEQLIQKLKDQGCIVGVITNGPPDHQLKKYEALALSRLIPQNLVYISGAVGYTKPDERIFHHVASKHGLSPENCWYIGDSWRNDVVGALRAGWHVIWFNHRQVTPESDHCPHHVASNYAEIEKWLEAAI